MVRATRSIFRFKTSRRNSIGVVRLYLHLRCSYDRTKAAKISEPRRASLIISEQGAIRHNQVKERPTLGRKKIGPGGATALVYLIWNEKRGPQNVFDGLLIVIATIQIGVAGNHRHAGLRKRFYLLNQQHGQKCQT